MSDHPNAASYSAARGRLNAGDIDGFVEHLNDDIVWWEVDLARPIVGRQALANHLRTKSGPQVTTEVHDLLANDEHLVALLHATADTPNGPVDLSSAEVIHFDEQGLMVKRQMFPSSALTAVSFYGIGGRGGT